MSGNDAMLELDDVESGYGDLQILRGISLTVRKGTIEVALGRNGVGKTTMLSTIAGLVPTWTGSVRLDGVELSRVPAYRRAGLGVAFVQEGKRIFQGRTLLENVMLGTHTRSLKRNERRDVCATILERFPMLAGQEGKLVGSLSGGQQQMVALAQAMAADPAVLLLDEPSAGLAPAVVNEVFAHVARLRDEGMTILLVEQLAEQALAIGDHVTVIGNGTVVASGEPSSFENLAILQEAYFADEPSPS